MHEPTIERIRVRYGETDQMGHAYYAMYLFWIEQARGAWCRDRGFTYKGLEERGFFLPVVEVHLRYKGEVHYDDMIAIKVWLGEVKRASIQFRYAITNESSGKVVTEGHTWHVLVGAEKRAISIPLDLLEMFGRPPNMNAQEAQLSP
ncbi:MAG: acyl-CoA thioesterase [Armatimonadetes bacterium]|nr:acyl-CoA thioesterase [Armatimonadota bacterium]